MSLQNKVVLITGASRGLGCEMARRFAERDARLILVAREAAALQRVAGELETKVPLLSIAADVSQDAERIAQQALDRFGHVDVLVNNASTIGSSPMPPLDMLHYDELAQVLRVNVLAPLHLTQLLLPAMKMRGHGTIVNITSDAAVNAYPGWGAYGTAKAALEHMSRIHAAELEGSGVVIQCVDPGDMNTRMHAEAEPGADLSHLPTPDRVAPFFVWLLEEAPHRSGRFEAQAHLAASVRG